MMIDTFTEILTQKTKKMGLRTASMMADLLNISEDSAYRRIKNPRSLRADELIVLAKEFDIDLNKLAQTNPNWLSGEYKPLNFENYTSTDFYKELESKLDRCIHLPHSQITYGAKEIPFFYYMWFPALAAFKTYIWNREFIKNPKFNTGTFNFDPKLESPHIKLAEKYLKVASHEIWSYETLYSTLYQIHHYKECGMFENAETCKRVLQEYDQLIELIHNQAEVGAKLNPFIPNFKGAKYKLYFTPMINSDNSMIFHTVKDKVAVVCSQMSGVVVSDCSQWVCSTEHWLKTCKENGTLLSQTGQGARNKFLVQDYKIKKKMLDL